jgi:hypothetical protein
VRTRPRRRRTFEGILSATELAFIRDEPAPESSRFLWIALTCGREERDKHSKAVLAWRSGSPAVLRWWIRRFPGTRPRCWWAFDAPEPIRQVVRGRGETTCGLLGVVCGRPEHWYDWTPDLAIESQAQYLRRHRLMTDGEAKRVPPEAFDPEAIAP